MCSLLALAAIRLFAYSAVAFHRQGLSFLVLDLDRFCATGDIRGDLGRAESLVVGDGARSVRLDEFTSCYARFVELPLSWEPLPTAALWRFRLLQLAIESMSGLVVNRPFAGGSNNSKPHQVELLRHAGFEVPWGVSTNDPAEARDFIANCAGGAIYKSNSGIRSVVQEVGLEDLARLRTLPTCPVYFQERIEGDNVRVHVVGDRCHGVLIRSSMVDYRYDKSGNVLEQRCEVPTSLAKKCVAITARLGLIFSGIDFVRRSSNSRWVCLEVNPMPGYHGYDATLGGEICESLRKLLDGDSG